MSVQRQCELLGLPFSTYYHQPRPESAENLRLLRRLDELYMEWPFFGSRRMAVTLQELFVNGRKPVLRPVRYSAQRISRRPSTTIPSESAHERISMHAERALLGIARRRRNKRTRQTP